MFDTLHSERVGVSPLAHNLRILTSTCTVARLPDGSGKPGRTRHVKLKTLLGDTQMKKQQGFTLIELMIVVAIIAILAAIAISQYQDYVIRSQVSEGSSLADGTKTAVAEFVNNYGRFAAANASYGLSLPTSIVGKYVTQVDVGGTNDGRIEVTFGNQAHTAIATGLLVFSPITHAGSIEWTCDTGAGTDIDNKYRPTPCRD